jgi:ABC-2 type transport system ATP-binding protein
VNGMPAVTTEGLSYAYDRRAAVPALDHVSLSIPRGVMASVVGPDGAGKTTLVKLLVGILEPGRGRVTIMGDDTVGRFDRVKKHIGYLSQNFTLYGDLTVDENIEFFAEIHRVPDFRKRRDELLEFTQLKPFRKRLADRLSGGMKQKLALAATLVHSPAVIVLDEPTTGVDPVSRREFWIILADLLKKGITIVMTTPYMDEAERSDLVGFLHHGRLLFASSPREVRAAFTDVLFEVVPDDLARARRILEKENGPWEIEAFGDRLHVAVAPERADQAAVREALVRGGVSVISLRRVPPSLENVFISLIRKEGNTES